MSKYIDYNTIDYRNDRLHDKSEEFLNGVIYMAERIEEAPSIDIVFCKECKHWTYEEVCRLFWKPMCFDDFCSYGETRENE